MQTHEQSVYLNRHDKGHTLNTGFIQVFVVLMFVLEFFIGALSGYHDPHTESFMSELAPCDMSYIMTDLLTHGRPSDYFQSITPPVRSSVIIWSCKTTPVDCSYSQCTFRASGKLDEAHQTTTYTGFEDKWQQKYIISCLYQSIFQFSTNH